jgi:cellulose synthase (UDP-forming)
MARFFAFTRATVSWLGGGRKFRVTSKEAGGNVTEQGRVFPQYLVLAVNLSAIPVGYHLYLHYHWLPAGGMFVNVLWASVNAWLAYSLICFTTQKKHQRKDYRFAVPVPVRVCQQGECRFGTIDDVSPSGFRLYVRLADETRPGERLSGELWLPGVHLPFTAEIRHLITAQDPAGDYVKAYGCEFNRQDDVLLNQLDRYLFGSGLQWEIQDLRESGRTPLQRLRSFWHGSRDDTGNAPSYWAAFVYRVPGSSGADEMAGLIEVAGSAQTRRKVLLYHPLNKGVLLNGRVMTRLHEDDITLCATSVRRIETQLTPIFLITTEVHAGNVSTAESNGVVALLNADADDSCQSADATVPRKVGLS